MRIDKSKSEGKKEDCWRGGLVVGPLVNFSTLYYSLCIGFLLFYYHERVTISPISFLIPKEKSYIVINIIDGKATTSVYTAHMTYLNVFTFK